MDKFNTLASLNCRNFVFGLKCFVHSEIRIMNSIMAFKDHSAFRFAHDSRFAWQSKDKVFVFKMSLDLACNNMEFVKRMHVGGMEILR